jgi:outer membrane protein TolC
MTNQQRVVIGIVWLAAAAAIVGCASPFDDTQYRTWRDPDPAVHSRDTLRSGRTDIGPEALHGDSIIPGDAGIDTYVRLALERNPSIRAAERRLERIGASIPQVTSLDDPMFQVAPFGEMAETAAGQVGLMTGVSQKLPFPGKLDTRGRIAEQDLAMAVTDLQQVRLTVIAETRRAYWSYYFSTRSIETTRESRKLLSQFKQIAETEYKSGTRSQPDVLRASVELSNLDNELITLDQRQATARAMLNQLMDRPVDAALPEPIKTEPERITEQLGTLLEMAATSNPTIQKVHERIEQYRARQKLARLNRWPDLTVIANYSAVDDEGMSMAANGKDQWWFGFGVNLPIWAEKYEAAEREALVGMLEGVADLTAQHNRVAFQVQEAYLKVLAQQKLVELFDDVIIPQAQQTVDASSSGYRAGAVDFLTLVDNWRKMLNFELMYHRALADMEQAVADLERAVGRGIARSQQDRMPPNEATATTRPSASPLDDEEFRR